MHKRKLNQYTQSVIRTIVTDLVYEKGGVSYKYLAEIISELLLLLCQIMQ